MGAEAPPALEREADVLRYVESLIRQLLPGDWLVNTDRPTAAQRRPDAVLTIRSPQGDDATMIVEVKKTAVIRDVQNVVDQLRSDATSLEGKTPVPLVVGRYLSPQVREWLAERDVPYADATGNIRIALDRPSLFLRDVGASKDPWRGPGRPRGSLLGEPAARVVRALADFTPPYSVPRLVELAGSSTGATYRVVEFLEKQALIERAPRGPIHDVRWRELLERWAKEYGFQRSNTLRTYLQPRGMAQLSNDLRAGTTVRYAVTGSLAAQEWAPYASARSAMIYADEPDRLAAELDLRPIVSGANVLLAAPMSDVVFARTQRANGLTIVGPSQAVVDLLTGPGRNPAEAQALFEWMAQNVDRWRRSASGSDSSGAP